MVLRTRVLAALAALAVTAVPLGAFAQTAAPDAPPSYARPIGGTAGETITGRIASFDGAYNLQLRDDRGFIDNVQLQQGTVINPTGVRLTSGMSVTIHGVNRGSAFAASVIDTPYQSYGANYGPVAVDGPLVYPAYPYPVYPYPYAYPVYAYPYGPNFSFGIGFGGRGFGGRGFFR
jgi:small nuclear ribonucleoprotein (snRNP)-like protein